MIIRQRQPLNENLIYTVTQPDSTSRTPAGRAPAGGGPIPPAWQNRHGDLDPATRAERGVVYQAREHHARRARRAWLRLLGLICAGAAALVVVGMLAITMTLRELGL